MNKLCVDASVWVAAQDRRDSHCQTSRQFLAQAVATGVELRVPAFARVEISCALARRMRDAAAAVRLTEDMLAAARVIVCEVDADFLAEALSLGTRCFLRGADALYAATAARTGSTLVSWDGEHLNRADGIQPDDWIASRN